MKKHFLFSVLIIVLNIVSTSWGQDLDLKSGRMFADYAHVKDQRASYGSFFVDRKGRYVLEPKKGHSIYTIIHFPINETGDYTIEAVLEQMHRWDRDYYSGYGIRFGFKDVENYYEVVISDNGKYYFRYKINGMGVDVIDWTYSSSIQRDDAVNKIKIWKHLNKFYIAINGQLVASPDALSLFGDGVGFTASTKGSYGLWSLKINQADNMMPNSTTTQTAQSNQGTNSNGQLQIVGSGTGFAIDKRGYFATNYHVIDSAGSIGICLQTNGEWVSYSAKIIKTDPTNDIAILKIDDEKFTPFNDIPYSFSYDGESIASEVFTLGYPQVHVMGTDVKYTTGVINSRTGVQGDPTHYQISAHIDHGNSGGPLFNSNGQIIAITDSGLNKAVFGDVNYAVKSTYLKTLIDASGIDIQMPNDKSIVGKNRAEQIKAISPYVALILIAR